MNAFLNKNVKLVFGSLLSLLVLVGYTYTTLPDGNLHEYFLDVGQGDSSLIKTVSNYIIMIDGGPNNSVLRPLGRALPFWSKKIDLLIATHPDSDHIGGLPEVLKRYQVGSIWVPEIDQDTDLYKKLLKTVQEYNVSLVHPREGDRLVFPDGLEIKVVWPKSRKPGFTATNLGSLVTLVKYGNLATLLTGDATAETQPYPGISDKVTILKVPHHGAKNSLNPIFMDQIRPEVAVISVGQKNKYGHPVQAVVEKIQSLGTKVLQTNTSGTIEVVSDGKNWYTRTDR